MDPKTLYALSALFGTVGSGFDPRLAGTRISANLTDSARGGLAAAIAEEEQAKQDKFGFEDLLPMLGTAVGSMIPGVGPIVGPAIGGALGGYGEAVFEGGNGLQGAMMGGIGGALGGGFNQMLPGIGQQLAPGGFGGPQGFLNPAMAQIGTFFGNNPTMSALASGFMGQQAVQRVFRDPNGSFHIGY